MFIISDRFRPRAKNMTLITKTPGGLLIVGESFVIRVKRLG